MKNLIKKTTILGLLLLCSCTSRFEAEYESCYIEKQSLKKQLNEANDELGPYRFKEAQKLKTEKARAEKKSKTEVKTKNGSVSDSFDSLMISLGTYDTILFHDCLQKKLNKQMKGRDAVKYIDTPEGEECKSELSKLKPTKKGELVHAIIKKSKEEREATE